MCLLVVYVIYLIAFLIGGLHEDFSLSFKYLDFY